MPDASAIASSIRELSDAGAEKRRAAAAALFQAGSDAIEALLRSWLADSGFSELVPRDSGGKARLTAGIAVEAAHFESIRAANGSPRLAEVPPDQDAREFELHFPGDVRLDILTTRDAGGDGAIARYLRKFGEGIQQVEIQVSRVARATEILGRLFGLPAVYPAPRAGADGTRVNFLLVPAPGGGKVLIELVEAA